MAEWKKVVVSGSAISQLDNDAGYLTTGTLGDFVSGSGEAARTSLNSLTSGELSQLENIGTSTISATQWGYVGALDQDLATTDAVAFTTVTADLIGDVTGTADTASYVAGADVDGNIAGNAGTATKLATARSFTTTGDVVITSTNFDGSANFTAAATIQAGSVEASMFAANASAAITGSATALSSSLANRITQLDLASFDLDVSDSSNTGKILNSETLTIQGTANEVEVAYADGSSTFTIGLPSTITAGLTGNVTGDLTGTASFATKAATLHAGATGVDLTLTGDLTVNGTTTTINTTNLEVTDKFISLNDGGSAADGGIVVEGQGTAFGWDESANRWAFDFTGATSTQTTITTDAYAVAVVTTDDANYRKNGNIRVQSGDIFIYVE
jgi:hypothetical protein